MDICLSCGQPFTKSRLSWKMGTSVQCIRVWGMSWHIGLPFKILSQFGPVLWISFKFLPLVNKIPLNFWFKHRHLKDMWHHEPSLFPSEKSQHFKTHKLMKTLGFRFCFLHDSHKMYRQVGARANRDVTEVRLTTEARRDMRPQRETYSISSFVPICHADPQGYCLATVTKGLDTCVILNFAVKNRISQVSENGGQWPSLCSEPQYPEWVHVALLTGSWVDLLTRDGYFCWLEMATSISQLQGGSGPWCLSSSLYEAAAKRSISD